MWVENKIKNAKRAYDDCLKLNVERYRILGTPNAKIPMCPICDEIHGKVFSISQWKIGVTVPPFCDTCRCTTVPHFDD